MCDPHYQIYSEAMSKPMPGIDKPPGADDSWRPSIIDHMRLACIAMAFDARKRNQEADERSHWERFIDDYMDGVYRNRGYTPAQIEMAKRYRQAMREMSKR